MKTDLIKRSDVLDYPIRIHHYDKEHGNIHFVLGIESVLEYVEMLPSCGETEAAYSQWLPRNPNDPDCKTHYCGKCGAEIDSIKSLYYRWCPECGFKMIGGRSTE
jgi:DNA-directed RNA polymerase subunit RPC12/RpoP